MKKMKKLVALSLLSVMSVTGCSSFNPEPTPNTPDDQEQTKKELKSISLSESAITIEEEAKQTITLTVEQEGLKGNEVVIEWNTDNYEVATIQGVGLTRTIKAEGKGKAKLTVTATYGEVVKTAECNITVTEKDRTVHVSSVTLNAQTLELTVGSNPTGLLKANILPENATDKTVTWNSSDKSVATVDSDGLVTAVSGSKTGKTTTITATSNDDSTKSASCVVTVIDTFVAVKDVTITSEDTHFAVVEGVNTLTLQSVDDAIGYLTATVNGEGGFAPTNAGYTWSVVQGEDLIAVSSTGQVTVTAKIPHDGQQRTAKVRATANGDTTKFAECVVKILPEEYKDSTIHVEDDGISFATNTPSKIEVSTKVTVQIVFSNNTNYRDINFSIKDGATATDTTGQKVGENSYEITAGKVEGSFTLRAVSTDNANAVVEKEFQIFDKLTHIQSLVLDPSIQTTEENPLVLWTDSDPIDLDQLVSTNPAVATEDHQIDTSLSFSAGNGSSSCIIVSANGRLTAKTEGADVITVRSVQDPEVSAQIYVRVKPIVIKSIELAANEKTLEVNDPENNTFYLNPVVYNGRKDDAGDSHVTQTLVSYESDHEDIATVNENGKVTAVAPGNATITVTSTVDPSVTAECEITVLAVKPKILNLIAPSTIMSYDNATAEDNLNEVYDDMYNHPELNKGNFFESDGDGNLYKIGNQGEFKFAPVASARFEDGTTGTYTGVINYNTTLEVWNGNEYVATDKEGNINFTSAGFNFNGVDFATKLANKKFRVTYEVPDADAYRKSGTLNKQSLEFTVIKGYNAYTLAELALFDNYDGDVNWTNYRSAHGVTASPVSDGAVVLHDNISISADVLPSNILWSKTDVDAYVDGIGHDDFTNWKTAIGYKKGEEYDDDADAREALYNSPYDSTSIMTRETNVDKSSVGIEGNFFSIRTKDIKNVVRMRDEGNEYPTTELMKFNGGNGSCAKLFGINSETHSNSTNGVYFHNLQLVGSSTLSPTGTDKEKAIQLNISKGGLICVRSEGLPFETDNVIVHSFFTGLQHDTWNEAQKPVASFTVNRTIAHDFYNGAMYLWASKNTFINDSYYANAGGPLIFMDEKNRGEDWSSQEALNFQPVECTATNVYLNNPLAGTEPWFVGHEGSGLLASAIISTGDPTDGQGWIGQYAAGAYGNGLTTARTISMKDSAGKKFANFIAASVCADKFDSNTYKALESKLTIHNSDDAELDMTKVAKDPTYQITPLVPTAACPIICRSSAGNAVGYIDATDPEHPVVADPLSFVSGQYMEYYLNPRLALKHETDGYFIGIMLGTYAYADYWA